MALDDARHGIVPIARTTTIEGRRVLVVDRTPPLPPTLELLLNGGRDRTGRVWSALRVAFRDPLRIGGAARACVSNQDHALRRWLEGFYLCGDGKSRYLSLHACAACGAVCVRDRSVEDLPVRLPAGRRPLRRDHVIGWYTGARPRNRVYT